MTTLQNLGADAVPIDATQTGSAYTVAAGRIDQPSLVYDRVTAAWLLLLGQDLHYGYFSDPEEPLATATARLTAEMARLAAIERDCLVLDVGCGVGTPASMLARQFGCRVTGISTSDVGIGLANANAERLGLSHRLNFEVRDGMANGFPDASFDRVWVLESSHLMPRKKDLLAECARVLKPGGRLVLCDIILRSPISLPELIRRLETFRKLDVVFGRAKMEPLGIYSSLAESSGLVVRECTDISEAVLPTFRHWRRNAHSYRRQVVELVGEDYWQAFIASCDVLDEFWKERKFGYGILLAEKPGHFVPA